MTAARKACTASVASPKDAYLNKRCKDRSYKALKAVCPTPIQCSNKRVGQKMAGQVIAALQREADSSISLYAKATRIAMADTTASFFMETYGFEFQNYPRL